MKTIKDSVHDHIEIAGVAQALLDTAPVQRLRHVRQLGTVDLVYPSANHTRFEHSLGVYHLADRALSQLGIEGVRAERVRAAAILHDVGHGPYGSVQISWFHAKANDRNHSSAVSTVV